MFSQLMGVTSLPSVVFLDKNGEMIAKVPGFVQAAAFSSMLAYIRDECYTADISFQDYLNGRKRCSPRR
jgi:thioredoxin-related protein